MRGLIAAAALCVAGCATQSSAPQPPAPGALPTDTHRVLPPPVSVKSIDLDNAADGTKVTMARGSELKSNAAQRGTEIRRKMGQMDVPWARCLPARMARETIDREGMTFPDAKGNPKMHPACVVERDSRAAALAAFRQLNLELPRISTNKRQVW